MGERERGGEGGRKIVRHSADCCARKLDQQGGKADHPDVQCCLWGVEREVRSLGVQCSATLFFFSQDQSQLDLNNKMMYRSFLSVTTG